MLLIIATLVFIIAAFSGLIGYAGAAGASSSRCRGVFWFLASTAIVMAYWDHEHRRFK